ncbi:MAG TPA: N-acetyl-alpha-D-glucosaminyl L-malate synthase BshA, partial [Longimicrobiales bacterium]|nr:N-acetyl-alpha-D-glucosaminyl L-malate synthase BshA [Longimicrobiales bacterium]
MADGRLKIGVTCYPVYGGSGAVATELGIELARRGHQIHFITYAQPFRLPYYMENIFYHEVEVPNYPLMDHPPYSLALSVAMHNAAVRHGLDILHVHYAIPHATSAWIAREMLGNRGVKVITTLHGTDITLVGQDPSFYPITRFSILKSDGLTAVSEYLRRETIQHFDVPEDAVRVIPNFVDLQHYRRDGETCRRSTFASPDEKIIMHISNFRPVKRVDNVVRVFAGIRGRLPAKLLLVGDGPERGRVQRTAEELNVLEDVIFLGKQESVAEILACADLFLLPSQSEAFGLVALEAMACGVPVVASRVGGIPDVVPQGTAGFLLPPDDVEGMADAGASLLLDPQRWREASVAARTAAERFDANRVVPMYEQYYEE